MSWFFYALLTPAIMSVSNYLDKFLVEKRVKDSIVLTIIAGLFALVAGLVILVINGFNSPSARDLFVVLFSGVLLVLYLIPYYKALQLDEASRVAPLFQFVPIFTLLLSSLILSERLSVNQALGFGAIIMGGIILSLNKFESGILKLRKSFWLMMISSFLFASVLVLFRFGVSENDFWITFAYQRIGLGIAAVGFLLITPIRNRFIKSFKILKRDTFFLLILNDGIGTVAIVSFSFALFLAPATLVSLVGGTQPFFILFYGVILSIWFPKLIKENLSKSVIVAKLIAVVVLFVGLYLLN